MTQSEKKKMIQKAIEFLKKAPNNKNKKRKSFLKALHIQNRKVFFDIFIPKVLSGTINNQYRRLKDLENILPKLLKEKPVKEGQRYIFDGDGYRAVIEEKWRTRNRKKVSELYLLTFFGV